MDLLPRAPFLLGVCVLCESSTCAEFVVVQVVPRAVDGTNYGVYRYGCRVQFSYPCSKAFLTARMCEQSLPRPHLVNPSQVHVAR
jgi:hypothetical protein